MKKLKPITAKKLREFRHNRGLTQKQFAAELGISQPNLCRLEAGKTRVDGALLPLLHRLFAEAAQQ